MLQERQFYYYVLHIYVNPKNFVTFLVAGTRLTQESVDKLEINGVTFLVQMYFFSATIISNCQYWLEQVTEVGVDWVTSQEAYILLYKRYREF